MSAPSLSIYDLAPGKVVAERYTIVGPCRRGGFSTVFEVSDSTAADGKRFELQLFPAGLFEDADQAREFAGKLEPWKDVDSGAVLQVCEIVTIEPANLAIVTEYPVGESLRSRLNRDGRLAAEEVVAIGRQLLAGLSTLHGHGLVHGDVKPHTVHVEGEGAEVRAQLVDGGVTPGLWTAKHIGEKTTLIGTPHYAPVEVFGGDAPDVRSDIYSAATVLFECLTGALPWAGSSFLEVFQAKLQDPPAMKTRAPELEVDAQLEEAITHGCLADRRKRYGSAQEFAEKLAALA